MYPYPHHQDVFIFPQMRQRTGEQNRAAARSCERMWFPLRSQPQLPLLSGPGEWLCEPPWSFQPASEPPVKRSAVVSCSQMHGAPSTLVPGMRLLPNVDRQPGWAGAVLVPTNDPGYWSWLTHGRATNAQAFWIYQDQVMSGRRAWALPLAAGLGVCLGLAYRPMHHITCA
jgi:hypothetical protein